MLSPEGTGEATDLVRGVPVALRSSIRRAMSGSLSSGLAGAGADCIGSGEVVVCGAGAAPWWLPDVLRKAPALIVPDVDDD